MPRPHPGDPHHPPSCGLASARLTVMFALVRVVSGVSLASGGPVVAVCYDGRPVTPLWLALLIYLSDFAVFWHLLYYKVSARNLAALCALEV